MLSKAIGRSYSRPRIIICVPNGVTSVEQRSIETAAHATGASEVFTIEEPMAAAIGAGLQIFEPFGNVKEGLTLQLLKGEVVFISMIFRQHVWGGPKLA